MTLKDVKVVNLEPGPAAQAFVAGQNEAAMTYEPYLSTVRAAPDKGKSLRRRWIIPPSWIRSAARRIS